MKATCSLPLGTVELIRQLAVLQNCTLNEAVRRAILTAKLVQGQKVLFIKNGQVVETLIPHG